MDAVGFFGRRQLQTIRFEHADGHSNQAQLFGVHQRWSVNRSWLYHVADVWKSHAHVQEPNRYHLRLTVAEVYPVGAW